MLHILNTCEICVPNYQTYWWQWFDYYMSPRPNIMHVLRWHCRSVLPIPWLWLPPSARRMAQIIIEIIIITIIITERGHETRLKSNMFFVWMFDQILLSWFFSPIWDYLYDGSLDFVGCSQERPSRIPDAGGPSRSRPWTWPPGTCQSCHEFVAAAPVYVATCFGSGRGAATQGGRKLAVRFWEELWGFFGCTFLEMIDWTASCWILPASHLINTSPCQASTGFQSCLHVIFELVFVSFRCPRHFIFHSFTFPIPWGMCHCLFMT